MSVQTAYAVTLNSGEDIIVTGVEESNVDLRVVSKHRSVEVRLSTEEVEDLKNALDSAMES
jgi:hypothetical protein